MLDARCLICRFHVPNFHLSLSRINCEAELMLYTVRNLKKIFNSRTVLDIPELSLERRKVYGLLGPNGSGKTTLLHILSFLDSPSEGSVYYEDRPVSFTEKCLLPLRKAVVLVDQHPILFSMSVYKNVAFGLKVRKVPKRERHRIIEECLDLVRMRDFAHADGHHLSGGETQRVAIARALACSPNVMLFDEPTSNVDVSSQIAIEQIIQDLHVEKGISVILSTHDLLQASKLADEKVFLFEGRLSSFIYENIFAGKVVCKDNRKYCLINEKTCIPMNGAAQGEAKISVNPELVKIVTDETACHSGDMLRGNVSQLTQEKGGIRMLVDVGIPLSVLMKRREYADIGVCVGDEVMLRCPEQAVEIIQNNKASQ